jgi:hypothetical protein
MFYFQILLFRLIFFPINIITSDCFGGKYCNDKRITSDISSEIRADALKWFMSWLLTYILTAKYHSWLLKRGWLEYEIICAVATVSGKEDAYKRGWAQIFKCFSYNLQFHNSIESLIIVCLYFSHCWHKRFQVLVYF